MTNEDVIEYLASIWHYRAINRLALHIAIKALEKQIPKKPYFEGDGYFDGELVMDTWICPCCGKCFEVDYEEYNHCTECGQAIDWSER